MSRSIASVLVTAGVLLLSGCGKEEAPTTPKNVQKPVQQTTEQAGEQVQQEAGKLDVPAVDASKVDQTADDAVEQADQATGAATEQADQAAQDLTADSATMDQAKLLMDEATQYIKDNKYDLAEKALDQLDKMKGSLPESMQSQVTSLRSMLDSAKKAGQLQDAAEGVEAPALPDMGK